MDEPKTCAAEPAGAAPKIVDAPMNRSDVVNDNEPGSKMDPNDIQDDLSNAAGSCASAAASNDDLLEQSINTPDEIMEGQNSTTAEHSFEHFEPPTLTKQNSKQYEYIKHGSRIKALLSTAFRAVADGFVTHSERGEKRIAQEDDDDEHQGESKRARSVKEMHAEDLARDKAEECVNLKRKIQDLQSQIQALQQENYASHQTSTQLQSKIDRTLSALQIASSSSANARAEADAAEAKADSLSKQVDEFHCLVEELRRGMEAVRGEHDEVSSAARSLESRLIQVESELGRATKVKVEAEEERDGLKFRAEDAERKARALTEKVDDYEHEIRCLKKDVEEMQELEKIRSERTNRIENELHVTRGTLLEATSATAEAESTVTSLNSVIEELRKENELLHSQITDGRDSANKERTKQNEALTAAEKEVQTWKLKCEEEQEANRSLMMDKSAAEKQVEQMKSRIAHLERRLNNSGGVSMKFDTPNPVSKSAVTPTTAVLGLINSFGTESGTMDSEPRKELTYISKLPVRESAKSSQYEGASRELHYTTSSSSSKYFSTEKENHSNSSSSRKSSSNDMPSFTKRKTVKSTKCCICQLDAMGMMKNCQCDKINCDKRAHMTCIARRNADQGSSPVLCE